VSWCRLGYPRTAGLRVTSTDAGADSAPCPFCGASATIQRALHGRQRAALPGTRECRGEVAERLNATVSKTVVLFTAPGVRIPPSPLRKAKNRVSRPGP
jgi:hypothetical protein